MTLSQPAEGYCTRPEGCVCGGDLPEIREGCSSWHLGVPEAVQAERDRWIELIARIGTAARCLYSVTPTGNEHIVKAVERLVAGHPPGVPPALVQALRFYGNRDHIIDGDDLLDSVSGEGRNWLEHRADPLVVEDGWIARAALTGQTIDWVSAEEDETPRPLPGEVPL